MKIKQVILDGDHLTIEQVVAVARDGAKAILASGAKEKMNRSRAWVEKAVEEKAVVYGVTTGFGAFQDVSINSERLNELQRNLILSHCAGVGEPFGEDVVRAMMLLRANALAKGHSGIRVAVVGMLIELLNKGVHPVVPSQGSVGASGDLAPLSHIAAVLIGEGEAMVEGLRLSGANALRSAGIQPILLEAKEGLALNNGTQAMTAVGALALYDAVHLARIADTAAAMTLEAVKGKSTPFAAKVHAVRPHEGQAVVARNIRLMTKTSKLVDSIDEQTKSKVQDSYSLRCTPQVHGASRDAMKYVRHVLETEINSATDNPLIFPDDKRAYSAGNFHGQPVAIAMDFLALAVAELGNISERRTAKLMDKNHSSGLPAFLAINGGVESGLMLAQYTAASLVSENKVLIHPASGDSIPTSANQEDHVSMGTTAARQAAEITRNVRNILAIELLCAAQALDFRIHHKLGGHPTHLGTGTAKVFASIRKKVHRLKHDRELTKDIELVAAMISADELEFPFN